MVYARLPIAACLLPDEGKTIKNPDPEKVIKKAFGEIDPIQTVARVPGRFVMD